MKPLMVQYFPVLLILSRLSGQCFQSTLQSIALNEKTRSGRGVQKVYISFLQLLLEGFIYELPTQVNGIGFVHINLNHREIPLLSGEKQYFVLQKHIILIQSAHFSYSEDGILFHGFFTLSRRNAVLKKDSLFLTQK